MKVCAYEKVCTYKVRLTTRVDCVQYQCSLVDYSETSDFTFFYAFHKDLYSSYLVLYRPTKPWLCLEWQDATLRIVACSAVRSLFASIICRILGF